MDINSCLMSLGLTKNESVVYLTLSAHGEMTGYECAKLTGISRSNAYIALAGLCEKGGAFISEGTALKYFPAPIREFCADKRRAFEAAAEFLRANMPQPSTSSDVYVTINGSAAIYNKMKNMIASCTQRLYISAQGEILEKLRSELAKASDRGLKVVIITEGDFVMKKAIIYNAPRKNNEVRLIVDSHSALTGAVTAEIPCSCLFSSAETFVSLFKDAMGNEIKLIEMQI